MRIRTRHSVSLDGYPATTDGWPAITRVTEFAPKKKHGIPEFGAECGAVAMGRTSDAIDQPGLILLPILLGDGLRLFPFTDVASSTRLLLTGHQTHPDGAIKLCYERS